jgi:hypothetical protein
VTYFLYADEVLDRVRQRLREGSPASRKLLYDHHQLREAVYARLPAWARTHYEWFYQAMPEGVVYRDTPEEMEADYKRLLERGYAEKRPIPRIVKVGYRKKYPKSKVIPLAPYEVTHWEFKDTHPGQNISAWEVSVLEAQLHELPLHPDVDRSWQVFQAQKGLTPDSSPLERLPVLLQNYALYRYDEQEAGWIMVEGKGLVSELMLAAYEDAAESKGKPLTEKEIDDLIYRERQTIADSSGIPAHKLDPFFDPNSTREKLKKRGKAAEGKVREGQRKQITAKYPEYPDILKRMKAARAEWREADKQIKGTHAFRVMGGIARIGTHEQRRYTDLGKEAQRMEKDVLGRVLTQIRAYA